MRGRRPRPHLEEQDDVAEELLTVAGELVTVEWCRAFTWDDDPDDWQEGEPDPAAVTVTTDAGERPLASYPRADQAAILTALRAWGERHPPTTRDWGRFEDRYESDPAAW
jgi:hypothetical protein